MAGNASRQEQGQFIPPADQYRRPELPRVQALWLALAGMAFAIVLLDLLGVEDHATAAWDRQSDLSIHHMLGAPTYPFFRDVTALGAGLPFAVLVVLALLGLHGVRLRRESWFVLGTVVAATTIEHAVNAVIARPRPHLFPHAVAASGYSFPSGHTTASTALTLALIYVVWAIRHLDRVALLIIAPLAAYALLIGLSRIVLGVHYPSDVLGGYALAAGCVALSAAIFGRA